MTVTDHDPATEPAPPTRTARLRATCAARCHVAAAGARRAGSRFARMAVRGKRNADGVLDALVYATRAGALLLLRAFLVSERWEALAELGAARVRAVVPALVSILLLFVAWLIGPASLIAWIIAAPALAWCALIAAIAAWPHTTQGRVRVRYGRDGWAGFWDHHRSLSAHAVRHASAVMRPTIAAGLPPAVSTLEDAAAAGGRGAAAGARARRLALVERLSVTDCGTWLGHTAVGPVWGLSCYASHRDVVGIIAPPQTAKTAALGHHVIDHPGAVFSTSTKTDVWEHTAALRSLVAGSGRVEVFNPEGLGGLVSTMRWSPLAGCWEPTTAAERAAALVGATSAGSGEDGAYWLDMSAKVLRTFLLAAALADLSMREVHGWVTDHASADAALDILEDTHREHVPGGWAAELRQVLRTDAKRTRESVFLTLSQAVAFMADPAVADTCCPGPDEPVFEVAAFIADRGTLYVIATERPHASIAPLVATFTTHVFETAKTLASYRPKGRLDPPLLLALDEAPLVNPVPLPRWVADSGGRGIQLEWTAQSPSQLFERWGERGGQTILNSTNALLVFGGLKLQGDLELISGLCGTRHELVADPDGPTTSTGGLGHARFERVPVCPPDRVRTLPVPAIRDGSPQGPAHALLIHRATLPTIIRMFPCWERADVRKAGPAQIVAPIRDVVADQDQTDPATGPIPVPSGQFGAAA